MLLPCYAVRVLSRAALLGNLCEPHVYRHTPQLAPQLTCCTSPVLVCLQEEIERLAARREELLGQLVGALGLGSEAAEEEAAGQLQNVMMASLPRLPDDPHQQVPKLVLASSSKVAAALEGLVAALQAQVGKGCGLTVGWFVGYGMTHLHLHAVGIT